MTSAIITNLEKLLGGPRDGALLRYSLGNEWLKAGDPARAIGHLRTAVAADPKHSASWKLLGRALAASGDPAAEILGGSASGLVSADGLGLERRVPSLTTLGAGRTEPIKSLS